jgi:Zn-dependent metalloprotease
MHRPGLISILIALLVTAAVMPAQAFVKPQQVQSGPETTRMLMRTSPPTAETQQRWGEFVAQHGEDWDAVWNPVTTTPHRIFGRGLRIAGTVSEANVRQVVDDFVAGKAGLLGIDTAHLQLIGQELHGGRWYTDFQQVYDGLDVIGGRVHVRLKDDGRVTLFGSDFHGNISISTAPSLGESEAVILAKDDTDFNPLTDRVLSSRLVVLPVSRGNVAAYHLAYEIRLRVNAGPAIWKLYIDADTGDLLGKTNEIYYDDIYGSVTGYIKPMYITDPDQEQAFVDQYVTVTGYGGDTTGVAGTYSIAAGSGGLRELTALLQGRWTRISNLSGPEASFLDSVAPGTQQDILWQSSNSRDDERNAYYHINVVHAKIKEIDPSYTGMDRQTAVRVNEADYCNAYWDGSGITLGAGYGSCQNLAMFSDVIYHEYGHGIVDFLYRPLAPSGAMHEAFADYTAAMITNEPYIGEGILGPGTYFRTMENNLRYPEDLTGEVHDDGRILGGALWDLRQALWPDADLVDSLWHFARYGKADNFLDYYYDVLETDDDDGNLSNGTPHYYEIVEAFGNHGIGPGLYIDITHDPIADSEDSTSTFEAVATVMSNMTLEADSLLLYYSTGGPYTVLTMLPTVNPDEYSATIPAQSYGTTVQYYIFAKAQDTGDLMTDPEGAPASVHTFSIGNDSEPPVIVHTAMTDQPDAGWPSEVTAEITDNLGLASVVLEYRMNGLPQTPVPMTNVTGTDVYQATFGVAASSGDYIEYRILATDASLASNATYEPSGGYNEFGIAEAYYYTFESGEEGWTHRTTAGWTDEWHLSTQRNHTSGGTTAWKCGSTGTGDYGANVKALLESPVMTIGSGTKLVFWHWIDAETYEPVQGSGIAWDGAAVTLVDSAGKGTAIDPVEGYPYRIIPGGSAPFTDNKGVYSGQSAWQATVFDLSWYEGSCQIRLKFGSDGYVGGEGWYIDDVMIWSNDALAGDGLCDDTCRDPYGLPLRFSLGPALPNPARGSVTVAYAVPSPGAHVNIQVFDVRGRLTATLVNEAKAAGRYVARWEGMNATGNHVAAGVYFMRMQSHDFAASSKVMLLR